MKNNSTDYKIIEGYEAIFFKKLDKIECLLQNLDKDYYENLCELFTDYKLNSNNLYKPIPRKKVPFKNNFKVKLSIGFASCSFMNILKSKLKKSIFSRKEKHGIFTLNISQVKYCNDFNIKKLLDEIGNSLLFEISKRSALSRLSIRLHHDVPDTKNKNWIDHINDLPNVSDKTGKFSLEKIYKPEPTSYFLTANTIQESMFYQFILYYHCLEYFFDNYDRNMCEEQKLEALLNDCFKAGEIEIKQYINKNKYLENYYYKRIEKNYSELIDAPITTGKDPSKGKINIKKIAKRIYKLRNAIVHKKLGR
ncbi:MAG: hypothetical protein KGY74_05680, partial [Candidatus Cloacimonetes bacterium]|nr:hypothetical protein [Candidatus Cloacimonadota bacterium]